MERESVATCVGAEFHPVEPEWVPDALGYYACRQQTAGYFSGGISRSLTIVGTER
jgi:hypothetical protein